MMIMNAPGIATADNGEINHMTCRLVDGLRVIRSMIMNNSWFVQELIEKQRRNDHILRAQKERLITSITKTNNSNVMGYRQVLVKIGEWLVKIGYRLQSRYDNLVATGIPSTAPTSTRGHAPPC